ncbi:hypothetical protein KUCAC02_034530, partial [Chaenocephalus aceratus]
LEKMSDSKDEEEDTSSVSSCLSLKSDWSKERPLSFRTEPGPSDTELEKMSDSKDEEEDTPSVSSCLSLKSDRSKGLPLSFRTDPGPSDTEGKSRSPARQTGTAR